MRAPGRKVIAVLALVALVALALGVSPGSVIAGGTTVKISIALGGNGNGTWRTDDGLISCVRAGGITSGTCSHTYDLAGGPIPFGYTYSSGAGSCYVQGAQCIVGGGGPAYYLGPGPDQSSSMEFRLLAPVQITVRKSGTGSGTVKSTPRGIDCGSDCKSDYAKTSSFTIKATAKSGSKFTKWTGGPCDRQGSTCTFTVGAGPYTVTAVFTKNAVATPVPEITEPPATPEPPIITAGPTAIIPTPFPTTASIAPSTAGPASTGAPPTAPAADEGGRSTLILVLGSLLAIILAAGGLYAMRSRRSTPAAGGGAGAATPPSPPPPPPAG